MNTSEAFSTIKRLTVARTGKPADRRRANGLREVVWRAGLDRFPLRCFPLRPRLSLPSAVLFYTASSLRTMVRALGRLPIPELAWSRGHETMVSKLDAV